LPTGAGRRRLDERRFGNFAKAARTTTKPSNAATKSLLHRRGALPISSPMPRKRPFTSKDTAELLVRCPVCGGYFDLRDAGQVFDHLGPLPHPAEAQPQ